MPFIWSRKNRTNSSAHSIRPGTKKESKRRKSSRLLLKKDPFGSTTGYTSRSIAIDACSGASSLVYGSGSRSRYGRYAAGIRKSAGYYATSSFLQLFFIFTSSISFFFIY
uniref:Uncharacterized protein n=1 Tax=Beta vulgaris subsp. maritima TaxID=350892 RepID=E6ZEJ0_BETVM|nr:hypothetical protein LKY74_mgp134 [Beta vulgaris subsp. maritima]CBJ17503.1 hypothetical protein [Beta vulgaris subsp. maritima]